VLSAQGDVLAVSDDRGTVRLWNALTRRPAGQPIASHHAVTGLALGPDGKVLAVAGDGLQVWSTATGQRIGGPLPAADAAGPVAISPDGRLVAAIGADGKARLWQVATQQETGVAVTIGPAAGQGALAFSPDGKTLATIDPNGTAALWSVATQHRIGTLMHAGASAAQAAGGRGTAAVAFSPDGTTLATAGASGGSGGSARLWDVAFPAGLLAAACAIADQSLTREQWADYAGTQPFQQVCPAS
jgi:WD40 repeat protein